MIETIAKFSKSFPSIEINNVQWKRTLQNLTQDMDIKPGRYAGMAIFVGMVISAITIGVLLFFYSNIQIATIVGASLIVFIIIVCFFGLLPYIEWRKRTDEMEAELPSFVRTLGTLVELQVPFERALEIASEEGKILKSEIGRAISEIKEGIGIRSALASIASRYESIKIKQTMTQILFAFEAGSSGTELAKLGKEMIVYQQHKLRDFSAKSTIFGLMFLMTSAIIPTFFLVYITMGKAVFNSQLDDSHIAIVLLLIFPLSSVLVLLLSKSFMPRMAEGGEAAGRGIDIRLLIPAVLFFIGALFLRQYIHGIVIVGVLAAVYLSYSSYQKEKTKEEIEKYLPDALLACGGLGKALRLENIFDTMERGGYSSLSTEAAKSRKQLLMNLKVDSVLEDLWKRNDSKMLRRACLFIKQMLHANALEKINLLAEDMLTHLQIKRERDNLLSIQKYTLILGGILVPLILKMALGLIGTTDKFFDAEAGGSSSKQTIEFIVSLIPAYLTIYSAISATAIADAEGKNSHSTKYFIMLATIAFIIFFFIN